MIFQSEKVRRRNLENALRFHFISVLVFLIELRNFIGREEDFKIIIKLKIYLNHRSRRLLIRHRRFDGWYWYTYRVERLHSQMAGLPMAKRY